MAGRAQGGYWFANALRESDLSPPARHIGHVLASVADSDTGRVSMSLTRLATYTGLDRSTVARKLNDLERRGWISRKRPEKWQAIKEGAMTEFTLLIPPGFPVRGSRTQRLGVVAEEHEPSRTARLSTTSTNADAGPALRAAGATATNPESLPRGYGAACDCETPTARTKDGDCVACGGEVA